MQRNSYVFGASMSPGGFAIPMNPAFGGAGGGLVAGEDPVVTEVEPGSVCAGFRQEWTRSTWTSRLRGEVRLGRLLGSVRLSMKRLLEHLNKVQKHGLGE